MPLVKIIAISGSLRERSSNAALLRAAVRVAPDGVDVELYRGLGELPHFNPDLDAEGMEPPPAVAKLRDVLMSGDAVLISSPEYAHGVPGALKNLLDWLVSTGELVDMPVALWNAAPAGGTYAQTALVETLRTMNWRVVQEASLLEPFVPHKITGEVLDEQTLATLRQALSALATNVTKS